MANGGDLPPMIKVMEKTHRCKDGTFVTVQAEQMFNEYNARLAELETESSPGGSSVQSTLGLEDLDKLYDEVEPKKRGRTMGVGSIRDTPAASSSARYSYTPRSFEP